ncbi:MAG: ABC transporter permease [Lachnospiraceae bacterium]|nr:ABC transporter permease [Lachnospiraceae bacterium]
MATYDLNEVLKKREAEQKNRRSAEGAQNEAGSLGDVSRVKVLSPGRQVFKRFIRNRLAVFGLSLLVIMFVFSFLGPLVYPYGQKQAFYTYDVQNVNYALAKENTAFNGYDVDASVTVESKVRNAMNSTIKKMVASGEEEMLIRGEEGGYLIRREADDIYTISALDLTLTASSGNSSVKVGTYSMIGKSVEFDGDEIPGLSQEAAKNVKGASGSFTVDGVEYTFEKGAKPKTFDIYTVQDGLVYAGEEPGGDFEKALEKALEENAFSFESGDDTYVLEAQKDRTDVYLAGEPTVAKIYTTYTLDTFETGVSVSDEFKAAALMAVSGNGEFESGGKSYTVEPDGSGLLIKTADGTGLAEFDSFTVRRYSGEDSMSYELKKSISEKIEEMIGAGEKAGTMTAMIPQQAENGSYRVDEATGEFILDEAELRITQRLEGEYVINCNQINYVLDTFASPSAQHILGTDGDGYDVMARIMYGGRVSLMVGFIVVFLETLIGVIMGGLAGYFGGWVDNLIMRLVDIFYCLPSLPIMIILGSMMDAVRMDTYVRLLIMMAALGLMGWAGVARMVRGQILSLREQEFMVATEATGIRIGARIFRHLIPNVMPQLIVIMTMGLGGVILTESTLSFLGLGVKHPLATWGTIINSVSSASAMAHYAFIWIPVGLLICLTVIAFNFVGDGLRDAYDPKSKR